MSDNRKLSNEEVSALIEGLNSGEIDTAPGARQPVECKPYVFGAEDAGLLGDLHTLRLINERFGRNLRNVLLPMLRFMPRISTLPPETKRFEEKLRSMGQFESLSIARADLLKGTILVTVPPRLISILVNTFFGGRGDPGVTNKTEFTPTEERILEIIVEGALKTLDDAWHEVFPVSFQYMNTETNPAFISFVEGSESVVVSSFVVQLPFAEPQCIEIMYPRQSLKQIATILRSKIQRVGDARDMNWERHLVEALLHVPLSFVPRIAEPKISLKQLMNVQVGMIVDIPAFEKVRVFVEGEELFEGMMGDRDGKLAVQVVG
jgi:flagellar motor switch protein FliM